MTATSGIAGYGNQLYAYDESSNTWRELTKNNKLGIRAPANVQSALGKPAKQSSASGRPDSAPAVVKALSAQLEDRVKLNSSSSNRKFNDNDISKANILKKIAYVFDPKRIAREAFGIGGKRNRQQNSPGASRMSSMGPASADYNDVATKALMSIDENIKTMLKIQTGNQKDGRSLKSPNKAGSLGEASGGGGGLLDFLGTMVSGMLPMLLKGLKGIAKKLPFIGPIILAGFGLWDAAKDFMETGDWTSALGTFFESIADGLTMGLASQLLGTGTIKNFTQDMVHKATDFFEDMVHSITDFFEDYVIKPLTDAPSQLISFLSKKIAGIMESLGNIKFDFKIPDWLDKLTNGKISGEKSFQPFAGLKDVAKDMRESADKRDQELARGAADAAGAAAETRTYRDVTKTEQRNNRDESKAASRLDTKKHEGFVAGAYDDPTGNKTIGYGHKLTAEELKTGQIKLPDGTIVNWKDGEKLTKEQGDLLYNADKNSHASQGEAVLAKKGVDTSSLSPAVKEALGDLSFNAGPNIYDKSPKLVQALKNNDNDAIAAELRTTGTTSNGTRLNGLVNRANDRADLVASSRATGDAVLASNADVANQSGATGAPIVNNVTNNTASSGGGGGNPQIASIRSDESTFKDVARSALGYRA